MKIVRNLIDFPNISITVNQRIESEIFFVLPRSKIPLKRTKTTKVTIISKKVVAVSPT